MFMSMSIDFNISNLMKIAKKNKRELAVCLALRNPKKPINTHKRCSKWCRIKMPFLLWPRTKLGFLRFFKIIPPLGGGTQKGILRLLSGTRGYLVPNLVEIHPVVWASNPNKQTGRKASFYIPGQ